MCWFEYKNIDISRKGRRLYFVGVFLAFLIAVSIPCKLFLFIISEKDRDIDAAVAYLIE